jgi:uridine kinase
MGASGSGQTTLGKALANKLAFTFLDADDFYWLPTTPAYQEKRDMESKLSLILNAMESKPVVIAGSIIGWGSVLEECFDLVVFLSLDTDIRISRLKVREQQELGFVDDEFIAWARQYENPNFYSRNRVKHLNWLASQQAEVVSIDGDLTVEQRITVVLTAMNKSIE